MPPAGHLRVNGRHPCHTGTLREDLARAGGRVYAENVYRSLLPAALAHGITTEDDSAATLADLAQDTARFASSPVLWPLMIGAWKRKGQA